MKNYTTTIRNEYMVVRDYCSNLSHNIKQNFYEVCISV